MSSNRVGPPPPPEPSRGSGSADSKKFREELQKVQKVKEVDPDEPSRQRNKRFAARMGDEEIPDDLNASPRKASPFEPSFHSEKSADVRSNPPLKSKKIETRPEAAVPSPAYSPPPSIDSPSINASVGDDALSNSLPNSSQFWEGVDLPDDPPPPRQKFQESPRSRDRPPQTESDREDSPRKRERKKKESGEDQTSLEPKQKEISPFDLPTKSEISTTPKKKSAKHPEEAEESPFAIYDEDLEEPTIESGPKKKSSPREVLPLKTRESQENAVPQSSFYSPDVPRKEKEKQAFKRTSDEENIPAASPFAPVASNEDRQRGKRNPFEQGATEIVQPSLPSFPIDVQPMAQTATVQAAPYLSPETMSLFYQMVGMIYVMTAPSGISRTEVVLNAPAFANSKFFGATITIEKYATAPDSLNIRLTGTNEAVQAFNQNLSGLVAAFQNGNFNFRIGRIDTAFSVDKPVFRRKERNNGNDSGSFKDQK